MDKPEYLGPMARSLVETFAGLTLPQQRRVFEMLRGNSLGSCVTNSKWRLRRRS